MADVNLRYNGNPFVESALFTLTNGGTVIPYITARENVSLVQLIAVDDAPNPDKDLYAVQIYPERLQEGPEQQKDLYVAANIKYKVRAYIGRGGHFAATIVDRADPAAV